MNDKENPTDSLTLVPNGTSGIEKTREELENGCGYQENYWKSSKCVKGNLCLDCEIKLKYFDLGVQLAHKEFLDKLEDEINYWLSEDRTIYSGNVVALRLKEFKQQLKENPKDSLVLDSHESSDKDGGQQ